MSDTPAAHIAREAALQRVLSVWIVTGLLFMLIPGTFLGVWNLISITGGRSAATISPAWIQAHGHAQIFGWIGSFILGIGFYSLSKMANLAPFHVSRAWTAWALWTSGVALRWATNLYAWHWRELLPASAVLELAGFAIFFRTVSTHKGAPGERQPLPIWMLLVMASTVGFCANLVANLCVTVWLSSAGIGPAIPHLAEQRLLTAILWAFIAPAIWGFSSRWLPVFLGLPQPSEAPLYAAYGCAIGAVISGLLGFWPLSGVLTAVGGVLAIFGLHLNRRAERPPKVNGVHFTFPYFIRIAYGWLLVGCALSIWAAVADRSGGIWGASRHALTVGFIATMVFSIGQRVLPAFCGMRILFSRWLMFASLLLLTAGCALRVSVEPLAYEGYAPNLWPLLPISAVIEMTAVTVFALNLIVTLTKEPEHVRLTRLSSAGQQPV